MAGPHEHQPVFGSTRELANFNSLLEWLRAELAHDEPIVLIDEKASLSTLNLTTGTADTARPANQPADVLPAVLEDVASPPLAEKPAPATAGPALTSAGNPSPSEPAAPVAEPSISPPHEASGTLGTAGTDEIASTEEEEAAFRELEGRAL